jgi:ABC-type nitrate/sulfonate/bicarbonate transport system substrate-binding protein
MFRPVHIILLCAAVCQLFTAVSSTAADRTAPLVFASQPLSAPGGTLATLLKHDRILRQELASMGLALQVIAVKKGGDAINMMQSGAADMATLGDMPMLEAAATMPLSIFARSRFSSISLVGEKGILGKDLKGKLIGYAPGTNGHFALLKILAGSGLHETDVKLAPMDVTEMGAALLQKKIDAFSAWEPTPEATIAANPNRFGVIGRQSSVSHVVIMQSTAGRHPELRFHLAAALVRAINWIGHDRKALLLATDWTLEDMRTLTGTASMLTHNQMASVITRELEALSHSPKIPSETAADSSMLAEELLFLKKHGKVSAAATWDSIRASFDFKAMEQVMKQPQIYQLTRYDYESN